uniref:Uncharacterized protein n=1 Tax=Arundo donax TaxID=35708 RepID=A0A0A9GBZ9_ARUDO
MHRPPAFCEHRFRHLASQTPSGTAPSASAIQSHKTKSTGRSLARFTELRKGKFEQVTGCVPAATVRSWNEAAARKRRRSTRAAGTGFIFSSCSRSWAQLRGSNAGEWRLS